MSIYTLQIDDLKQFESFCAELAAQIKLGDVVALNGDLGVGKTTMVQILCQHWGVLETVNSPTFSITHCYTGQKHNVVHVDAYRIESEADAKLITLDEAILERNSIVLVEWANKLPSFDACWTWKIQIQHKPNAGRLLTFERYPNNLKLSKVFASCTTY